RRSQRHPRPEPSAHELSVRGIRVIERGVGVLVRLRVGSTRPATARPPPARPASAALLFISIRKTKARTRETPLSEKTQPRAALSSQGHKGCWPSRPKNYCARKRSNSPAGGTV